MRYITFFVMAILVLEKLKKDEIIKVYGKKTLNRALKQYYVDNKETFSQLR